MAVGVSWGSSSAFGKLRGLDKVTVNLQKKVMAIEGLTARGLLEAVSFLREQMDYVSPTIPVDVGNLRASWFITTKGSKGEGILFAGKSQSESFKGNPTVIGQLEQSRNQALKAAKEQLKDVKIGIGFGFSAYYAAYVHEMLGEDIAWTREGSGAKWFQAAIKREKQTMLMIIKDNAQISNIK
jgi:hypothetical protein